MATEQSRFFDSVGGDKKYQADQFAEYFRMFLSSGIRNGGENLKVSADGSGMHVTVNFGTAMLEGYAYWLKDDGTSKTMPISAAGSQPRIDRIVLRLDKSLNNRFVQLSVLQGVEAASPLSPALTREGNIYEISLARVKVAANAMFIQASDIVDERLDQSVCGLMNSLITLDTQQLEDIFNAFMDEIKTESPVLHNEVANNLTTTENGKVLDARQGKTLKDSADILTQRVSKNESTLNTHTANTTVHISLEERNSWNGRGNSNLLINSNFLYPVNQRGNTSASSSSSTHVYMIDRWALPKTTGASMSIGNDGLALTSAGAMQFVEMNSNAAIGKSFSCSAEDFNGNVRTFVVQSLSSSSTASNSYFTLTYDLNKKAIAFTIKGGTWRWAKLETGSYATPFSPRPYADELVMCQRYYESIPETTVGVCGGSQSYGSAAANASFIMIPFKTTKRTVPTITVGGRFGGYSTKSTDETTADMFIGYWGAASSTPGYTTLSFTADAEIY